MNLLMQNTDKIAEHLSIPRESIDHLSIPRESIDQRSQRSQSNPKIRVLVPKLPHCAQSPDLDGVIKVVSKISKKTENEIRDMITLGKVTLTAKIIKDIFKEIGIEGKWCYNTSYCKASKEEMQKGLLDILTGAYKPSVTIRGDVFEKLVKEKMDAESFNARQNP